MYSIQYKAVQYDNGTQEIQILPQGKHKTRPPQIPSFRSHAAMVNKKKGVPTSKKTQCVTIKR
jgi:hypothetical protein